MIKRAFGKKKNKTDAEKGVFWQTHGVYRPINAPQPDSRARDQSPTIFHKQKTGSFSLCLLGPNFKATLGQGYTRWAFIVDENSRGGEGHWH